MNDIVVIDAAVYTEPDKLALLNKGDNYLATIGRREVELVRGEDFGKVGKAKSPALFKPGAEKVIWAYELLERYTLESAEENHDDSYFFYRFRCDLVKVLPDMREVVVKSGWGSANTKEGRNGTAGGYNAANNAVKMAKKRAMVDAAISIGRLSGMFTQDIENEDFMDKATTAIEPNNPEAVITPAQVKRIFAIGGNYGISTEKVKNYLASLEHPKVKEIKQKDYNAVCDALEQYGKNGGIVA